ncbi:MAG: hypothetical protein NC489_30715, partial [Ruminococcus flavefaciens]|nr:hypothetical protein [Ruminococcus flavefaciens]
GVRGNNLVDKLEFVIKRYTDTGIDLSTCTPYIKLQNEKEQYFDKDGRVEVIDENGTLRLVYKLSRKTTMHASFDLQIQFEQKAESDVIVWQTEAITFTLSRTIPADVAIANQYPTVLQDLTARVEKIENTAQESTDVSELTARVEKIEQIKFINGGTP